MTESENTKLVLPYPLVTEGKYDKLKLKSIVSTPVITTDGFSVFNNQAKLSYIRAMCRDGAVILTDSDRAGFFLRSRLKGLLPECAVLINVYIPRITGKERRKSALSREGLLGVEGISNRTLRELLEPYALNDEDGCAPLNRISRDDTVTKADLYAMGLSGTGNSTVRRAAVCASLGLPELLTANALIDYVNLRVGRRALYALSETLRDTNSNEYQYMPARKNDKDE